MACKTLAVVGDSWTALQSEYQLDIEYEKASHGKFIGSKKAVVIRVGSFRKGESAFNAKELVTKMDRDSYRVPRMRFTAQKTAFCMAAAAHMPIKNDEEDEEESEDESEGEDPANGDDSASVAVAATAAAAARTTTDSALSPTLAVPPDRKRSVEIDLNKQDLPVTVTVGSGAVMTWIRVPKSSSLEGSRKHFRRSNFFPNLLNAVADKDNEENAAFWLFMAAGRKYPKGFEHAAKMLGYIPKIWLQLAAS
jgi:hypothetical protein